MIYYLLNTFLQMGCTCSKQKQMKPIKIFLNIKERLIKIVLDSQIVEQAQKKKIPNYILKLGHQNQMQIIPFSRKQIKQEAEENKTNLFFKFDEKFINGIYNYKFQIKEVPFIFNDPNKTTITIDDGLLGFETPKADSFQLRSYQTMIKMSYDTNLIQQKYKNHIKFQLHLQQIRLSNKLQKEVLSVHNQKQANELINLDFLIKSSPKRRVYQYNLMINKITQTKTQSVKTGTIVIKGIDQNHTNLQLRREDSPNFDKILDTLNQLRTHDDTVNILVIGKVGQGKSTYINYTQHILQKSFNYLIDKHAPNAESQQTVTKSFKLYPHMCNSSNSRINFIDGPGIGPPNSKMNMTFKQYKDIYLKAFDTLLKGRLDYSAFEIPDKIDVKSATTASPDYDKIIHYCLVFVDINENGQVADFVKDFCKCLTYNNVRYGIVFNKADLHIDTLEVDTRFPVVIQKFKQVVRDCNYKVNADHLFITSLKLQLFADNNEIFHEYTRSFEYALESSLQYSRTNIIKIYLKKISNEKFIGSIHRNIASSLTLQDYIKENRENIHLKDLDYQKNLLIRTQRKIVPVSVKEFLCTPLQELVIHSKEQFTIHLSIKK